MDGRRGLVRQESRKTVARAKQHIKTKAYTYTELITLYHEIILHMKRTASKLTNWTPDDDETTWNQELRDAQDNRETRGTPVRTSFDLEPKKNAQ